MGGQKEVVRCKNCIYSEPIYPIADTPYWCKKNGDEVKVFPNEYCSRGEANE